MLLNCLILSISVTVDAMGIGITYGLKNVKLNFIGILILFVICYLLASISVLFGETLKNIVSEQIATCIGTCILVSIGLFVIYKALTKKSSHTTKSTNKIEIKESFFLALAVSIDAFCIGMASGILGLGSFYFPLFVAVFHINFLQLGIFLGQKISSLAKLPNNIWSLISGILLICIGLSKLLN